MSAGRSVLVEIYVRMSGYAGKSGKARPLLCPHPLPGAKDLSEKASGLRAPVSCWCGPQWATLGVRQGWTPASCQRADMVLM